MRPLDAAILRTVLYADVFHFPLTTDEIHHFLIADAPCTLAEVQAALGSAPLAGYLTEADGYVMLRGREALAATRAQRGEAAAALWSQARHYGAWLSRLPFVRMVAVTGALAMHNPAHVSDDIDYVLVIAPGRVWLARLLAIVVVRLARARGVTLCPNYVLSEAALRQERRDLYIAHEVTQMAPLYGLDVYQAMRAENGWAVDQLPNAIGPFIPAPETHMRGGWTWIKRAGEALLSGRIGDAVERWEFRRKRARFTRQLRETSAARIDADSVKGHFNDHGARVLDQYRERARAWGVLDYLPADADLPLAGD